MVLHNQDSSGVAGLFGQKACVSVFPAVPGYSHAGMACFGVVSRKGSQEPLHCVRPLPCVTQAKHTQAAVCGQSEDRSLPGQQDGQALVSESHTHQE